MERCVAIWFMFKSITYEKSDVPVFWNKSNKILVIMIALLHVRNTVCKYLANLTGPNILREMLLFVVFLSSFTFQNRSLRNQNHISFQYTWEQPQTEVNIPFSAVTDSNNS